MFLKSRTGYENRQLPKSLFSSASSRIRPTGYLKRSQTKAIQQNKPLTFREFIALANPKYKFYRHLDKLISILQRVADGEITRLMVFLAPRHGKSELISRLLPAYFLHRHPDRWVGLSSYADALASTLSRNARDNYRAVGGVLNPSAEAVHHWETGKGGGMWAAGVGGPILGKGFHLGIIDDPVKNADEARSPTIREKHKDWYRSTFGTREEPNAAIVIVQQRWNEDDLSGWLLAQEQSEDELSERWHIVSMPAIKGDAEREFPTNCTVEPDDRQPGEALFPERYNNDKLARIKRRIGTYYWSALYMQSPTPIEGSMFKRHWFDTVREVPAKAKRVRWWDRAATSNDGDYTVGVLMAYADGIYYVEDVVRGRWSSRERDKIMRNTAESDAQKYSDVEQWTEQEPGSSGKDAALAFVRLMDGFGARYRTSTGSKEVRADPFSAQAEAGNVKIKKATWNPAYLQELAEFPNGTYDDQVDGSSGSYNRLVVARLKWEPGSARGN